MKNENALGSAGRRKVIFLLAASFFTRESCANIVTAQMTPFGTLAGYAQFFDGPRIPVFLFPNFPLGGAATVDHFLSPLIIIGTQIPRPFFDFVVAHEYAHHILNHLTERVIAQMQMGGFASCVLTPIQELEADAWATQALKELGNPLAVQAAFNVNLWTGFFAAQCYPPGILRAQNIRNVWFRR